MQTLLAPLFRLLPPGVTVTCGANTIQLNYEQRSARGRCIARTELPYGIDSESLRERIGQFRFCVARLRYQASHS